MIRPSRDTHARSVAKALSWRLMGTFATSTIVFLFTRQWALSLFVGGIEFVSKIALFWVHERAWDRLPYGRESAKPSVIWFTGLSGSGKSTIATQVTALLTQMRLPVEHLDGDSVRKLFPSTGFSRAAREEHLRRVGFLASRLESHGVFVVASFVSPYQSSRAAIREMCRSFIEVHVSTPLAVCEERDTKGLYARARRGEIADFTGISAPYEAPEDPELVIDTTQVPVDQAARRVLALLHQRMNGAPHA